MKDLTAELERAEVGSRELDMKIRLHICPLSNNPKTVSIVHSVRCPSYTTSLDAALTLVPERWKVYRLGQSTSPNCQR